MFNQKLANVHKALPPLLGVEKRDGSRGRTDKSIIPVPNSNPAQTNAADDIRYHLVDGNYEYYHYKHDGFNDVVSSSLKL